MKEVILNQPASTILLSDVTVAKYYGLRRGNEKAFVARGGYNRGAFRIFSGSFLTNGNGYSEGETLEGVLKLFLNGGWQVFQFETPNELFKWLSE